MWHVCPVLESNGCDLDQAAESVELSSRDLHSSTVDKRRSPEYRPCIASEGSDDENEAVRRLSYAGDSCRCDG